MTSTPAQSTDDSGRLVVDVANVSKRFCPELKRSLKYGFLDLLSELAGRSRTSQLRKGEFLAVRDVSFQVRAGECVGLMGHNGAGKSTMLKMINGIIKPDQGDIRIRGRVSGITQLGAGFNPTLTGIENILINGAVLGFTPDDIQARMHEIVEFSELGDAVHNPVKTYSSGMRTRLGFSVAATLRPDVLLLDEVLATGDRRFKFKCIDHLHRLRDEGLAIIIVSHAVGRLARLCTRSVVFEKGQLAFDGPIDEGIARYEESMKMRELTSKKSPPRSGQDTSLHARISEASIIDDAGQPVEAARHGHPMSVAVSISAPTAPEGLRLFVHLENDSGLIATMATKPGFLPQSERHDVKLRLPDLALLRGSYVVTVKLTRQSSKEVLEEEQMVLEVASELKNGTVRLDHEWERA